MKKIIYYTCITFASIGITSCGKKTNAKIVNTWRVVSYSQETTDGTNTYISSIGDSPETPNELIIEKDGTWIWKRGYSSSGTIFGGSVFLTNKGVITQRGTWSSVMKVKGGNFINNEHVLFNTLSDSKINTQTGGGNNPLFPDTTTSSSQTYPTGEKTIVYTVTNSTPKELWLESESSQDNSSGGVSSKKIRLTLKIKE
ncbi:hypothetical protein [Fluviicola taffensis]|uniref:Lipocalin-like domain-containing protein n=1 Tax=Fluviicola taffensis (strain DSM 16823 / NCIMB 13979 / RW262) TaxID=755732 RepID=F2IFB6_FLUTR|nr:hypothetical protein [Fluviicola taffensis]AEA44601.1 hypothetical protein Fluta_2617 [Fluviicola taffensis DSM 16823]